MGHKKQIQELILATANLQIELSQLKQQINQENNLELEPESEILVDDSQIKFVPKHKGGRGNKNPFGTITVRIPLPLKEQVSKLVSDFYLANSSPFSE